MEHRDHSVPIEWMADFNSRYFDEKDHFLYHKFKGDLLVTIDEKLQAIFDQGRNPKVIQGWTKVCFPGSVNMRCVPLPAAGRRTQIFHLKFTEPGKFTLAHPGT